MVQTSYRCRCILSQMRSQHAPPASQLLPIVARLLPLRGSDAACTARRHVSQLYLRQLLEPPLLVLQPLPLMLRARNQNVITARRPRNLTGDFPLSRFLASSCHAPLSPPAASPRSLPSGLPTSIKQQNASRNVIFTLRKMCLFLKHDCLKTLCNWDRLFNGHIFKYDYLQTLDYLMDIFRTLFCQNSG